MACLDHTYPPEKFLAHLSARVTFQLGPQPIDLQSNLTWPSRRMSLLYCSLSGAASNWNEASHKCIKMIDHPFSKFLRNNSLLKNTHTKLKLKLFPLSKRIMKMFVTKLSKLKPLLNKAGITKIHPPITLNAMKFSPVVFPKN